MAAVVLGQRPWQVPAAGGDAVTAFARELNVPPLVAQVMWGRGMRDVGDARRFLGAALGEMPDPASMLDCERAARRIIQALEGGERITVYGDYDVDGVTSSALLQSFFRSELDHELDVYIPHRMREGYGLNTAAIDRLASAGTRVLITVDNGSSASAEVAHAAALGLDVIIIDHHQVSDPEPVAFAHLNPHRRACAFPDKRLAAVGVAFVLLVELRRQLRQAGRFDGREAPRLDLYLDLVALGTVADVAALTGINRAFVRHGVSVMRRRPRLGLRALMDVSKVDVEAVTARDLGFKLGPRINAAGRLDDATRGLRLLMSSDEDEARALALDVEQQNQERRQIEVAMTEMAVDRVERDPALRDAPALVLADPSWHVGVVGIVAARLAERFHRPSILLAHDKGQLKGSARSVPGFDVKAGLDACAHLLVRHGGHVAAAGLTLEAQSFDAFVEAFSAVAARGTGHTGKAPPMRVDAEVSLDALHEADVEAVEWLGPFGEANPAPVLVARGVRGRARKLRGGHLKLDLTSADGHCEGIGWGMEDAAGLFAGEVDLLFAPAFETWEGRRKLVLRLVDLRPAGQREGEA